MNPTTITAQPGTPYIDVVREFDAAPELVFRAHTDPELVARWLGPRGMQMEVLEHDARTGGGYRYVHRGREGEFRFRGVFHTVVPDKLIVQTFEYEGMPEQVSLETARFEGIDGRTRLTMRRVFGSVEERDEMVAAGMENGVRDSMERLAEVLRPGRVVVDITMSLDGYVTAPGVDLEHGLGVGGEALHAWVFSQTPREQEILATTFKQTGAVVMGRRLFDIVDGPHGWSDEMGYGARQDQSAPPPVFVLTHEAPEKVRLADRFRFVTDGPANALRQAKAAAGDKDVVIMGGGTTCYEFLQAGLVDVMTIHVAPLVLGGGTPLFPGAATVRLELLESEMTAYAQHLTYRVLAEPTASWPMTEEHTPQSEA
jgi:uncharacterized protein YndB with AHSA1/START domain/dihydrofolate reductase